MQDGHSLSPADKKASASSGLLDVILDIGRERQQIMEEMKAALLRGDDEGALDRAREFTGDPQRVHKP
jgi:hypothetical protein